MRILVDASPLGGATFEERMFFREVVRSLLLRGHRHTYTLVGWPHASCGDCATFLSPLPRSAASWSVGLSRASGGCPPVPLEAPCAVYSPLSVPCAGPHGKQTISFPSIGTRLGRTEDPVARPRSNDYPAIDGGWTITLTRAGLSHLLGDRGFGPARIRWIPPPASLCPAWESFDRSAPLPKVSDSPYLVTSTSGAAPERFSWLLDGFRRYRRSAGSRALRLIVLGRSSFLSRQRALLRGMGRGVRFLGDVPLSFRAQVVASARAFLSSGGGDLAWFPAGEALATGVPVIAPRELPMTEFLGESALYYAPGQPGQMALEIWRCLECPTLARVIAQRGIQRARAFSWEAFTSRLLDLFFEVETYCGFTRSPPGGHSMVA